MQNIFFGQKLMSVPHKNSQATRKRREHPQPEKGTLYKNELKMNHYLNIKTKKSKIF